MSKRDQVEAQVAKGSVRTTQSGHSTALCDLCPERLTHPKTCGGRVDRYQLQICVLSRGSPPGSEPAQYVCMRCLSSDTYWCEACSRWQYVPERRWCARCKILLCTRCRFPVPNVPIPISEYCLQCLHRKEYQERAQKQLKEVTYLEYTLPCLRPGRLGTRRTGAYTPLPQDLRSGFIPEQATTLLLTLLPRLRAFAGAPDTADSAARPSAKRECFGALD